MTTRPLSRAASAALLLGLALGASACSDDEPGAAVTETVTVTATPSDPVSSTPPPAETTTPDVPTPEPNETTAPVPGAGPTTYDEALELFVTTEQDPQEVIRFETEAGTYCLLDSDAEIGCELPAGGIPDPGYCGTDGASQAVGRISFDLAREADPTAVCNSDTIREEGAPVVGVGEVAASSATGIQCLVQDAGVTCLDPAGGVGFFLGADSYTILTAD